MTRVYIAAPIRESERAREFAAILRMSNIKVISSWHDSGDDTDPIDDDAREEIWDTCRAELDKARIILAITDRGRPRAAFTEIGYALGRGKPIVWLSAPDQTGRNIADADSLVTRVTNEKAALDAVYDLVDRMPKPVSVRKISGSQKRL